MGILAGGSIFAREYARLFDRLAPEERAGVEAFCTKLGELLSQSHDFRNFLNHPSISEADKIEALKAAAPVQFTEVVWRVFGDILKRRVVDLFPAVASEMDRFADEAQNIHEVTVCSAVALSESSQKSLSDKLSMYLGGGVKMHFNVDPSLLSGYLVRIGDMVLDNTIKTGLQQLRQKLMAVSST
jgi:F-type H+-transporting ATPase subunit delta